MKQPNRVKAAMRAGRKAYGYNLSFPSPWVIDILGKLDFDFVFIDGEHGPFGLDQLEDLCRTAERHNVTTIARVPDIGSSTILRYLDRGIMGILGPHIATEADARQLVRACYFGPLGERSFGANRGTDYNAGIADKAAYYREANEQMLVCALLEDVAVLDNLDAILVGAGHRPVQHWPERFRPKSWLSRPARPSGSRQDDAGNHASHPTGWPHDARGRDARGVGQRYAARGGSSHHSCTAGIGSRPTFSSCRGGQQVGNQKRRSGQIHAEHADTIDSVLICVFCVHPVVSAFIASSGTLAQVLVSDLVLRAPPVGSLKQAAVRPCSGRRGREWLFDAECAEVPQRTERSSRCTVIGARRTLRVSAISALTGHPPAARPLPRVRRMRTVRVIAVVRRRPRGGCAPSP